MTDDEIKAKIRAVKAIEQQKIRDKLLRLGYGPDDIVFLVKESGRWVAKEKIQGSIVEWQIKKGFVLVPKWQRDKLKIWD